MNTAWIRQWLGLPSPRSKRGKRPVKLRPTTSLRLESLEQRLAPATFTATDATSLQAAVASVNA